MFVIVFCMFEVI